MTVETKVFLYCCQWTKRLALNELQAYVEGFHGRLIPTFDNIEEEAEKASQEIWEGAESASFNGYGDSYGDLSSDAFEVGLKVYENLSFVREQLIQLSVAGLYHLWERAIKQFIIKELKHYQYEDSVFKVVEKATFEDLVDILQQFTYDITVTTYYQKLNELRLVANVVKHGKGKSLEQLAQLAPHLFENPTISLIGISNNENLNLMSSDFMAYSNAIQEFWTSFPERVFLRG